MIFNGFIDRLQDEIHSFLMGMNDIFGEGGENIPFIHIYSWNFIVYIQTTKYQ